MQLDVDLIFKIGGIGILAAVLHTVLKQAGKEEAGWLTTLTAVGIVLIIVIRVVGNVFTTVKDVFKF